MTRRGSIVTWCVALGVLTAASAARATIVLRDPQPAKHDRFYVGDDKAFIGDPYDFSGVGRVDSTGSPSRWVTMISPSYFLSASHWHPADGATVKFHYTNDPDGAAELRTVVSGVQIGDSDVWLGQLASPVSSSVAKYPLLELQRNRDYNGLEILTFGLTVLRSQGTATTVRLGRNEINRNEYGVDHDTGGWYYRYEFDDPGLGDDESYLRSGDSGGPSFTIYEEQPALTGIHWFIDDENESRDFSGDSFLKPYVADIRAAMIGERPTVFPTPSDVWTWGNQGGEGDSRWATAANWEPGQIPGLLSVSTIGNGDTVVLDVDGRSAETVLNHGLLHVTGVGTLTVDNVEVGPASRLTVDGLLTAATVSVHGTLAGDGTVHAGSIDVLQTVAPGNDDVGTLTVGSGEMQLTPSATYEAELSLAASDARADVIEVSLDGTLQLGGTLAPRSVGRTDSDDWALGVIRRVVNSPDGTIGNTISGTGLMFDQIAPAPAATAASHIGQGAFLRDVHYVTDEGEPAATTGVDVELFVALGGDADGDGKVWLSDWALLRANFGNTGTGMTWTDGNFDPWIDDSVWLSDWATLRATFGNQDYTAAPSGADLYADVDWGGQTTQQSISGSSAATGSSVGRVLPEPGTLTMLLVAALLGVGVASRKCRMQNEE